MSKRKKSICFTFALLILISFAARAASFYVVIASFSEEARAMRFSESVSEVFQEASFRFDEQRKLFHVFMNETNDYRQAVNHRKYLQDVAGFSNAWIFAEGKDNSSIDDDASAGGNVKLELYTGSTVLLSSSDNSYMSISRNTGEVQQTSGNDSGQAFSFITKNRNGHLLPARVSLLDNHGTPVSTFKTNEVVGLSGKNGKERLTLVCDAPGYSTERKIVDLRNLAANPDIVRNDAGVWEVAFEMTRVKAEDLQFVYRGLFHKDASVVDLSARQSLEVLVALLNNNRSWRIAINSHTNPGPKRKIAVAASEDVDGSLVRFKEASDKQLTSERAQVLQRYLVAAGISKDRIKALGWGSLAKVADPAKADGHLNDRVEVVVLWD